MDQLSLFNESETSEIIIPEDVISPLECSKSVKSKEFRKVQDRWHKYVKSIQDTLGCSFLDAREVLIKHRDNQLPISIRVAPVNHRR